MQKALNTRGSLRALYETMALIRAVETSLLDLFSKGKLRGTVHTGIGQEGIAAGAVAALDNERDIICSNHRGHGHYLAYCGDSRGLIAEIMGLSEGVCKGVGGSQHLHKRNFYSNGILGGMAPVSVGMAMAEKTRKSGAIVVQFAGDGALAEGAFYEAFNLAALWKLPYMLVVEDNGYAQSTPKALEQSGTLADRPRPFGIPVVEVDGNDVEAVYEAAESLAGRIRGGEGPGVLYCTTYRLAPHSKGDDIRAKEEIADAWTREPLARARAKLNPDVSSAIDQAIATHARDIIETLTK
ncbi:MAG: thiamine pyrophosphate-dependent dehydrogenase E1 component subunit alpha [Hyphomicrobium sp.]|jgi:TPP-dependent pyruvate/acetoin dehydrogenase alpha subunit